MPKYILTVEIDDQGVGGEHYTPLALRKEIKRVLTRDLLLKTCNLQLTRKRTEPLDPVLVKYRNS